MRLKYAIIENNIVTNILESDADFASSIGAIEVIDEVKIGDTLIDGQLIIDEKTYIDLRQEAYPLIQEQLDMQYWDKINGTTVWEDTIAEIKAKYPKPEEVTNV